MNIWTILGQFLRAEFTGVKIDHETKRFALTIDTFLGGSAGDGGWPGMVAVPFSESSSFLGPAIYYWYTADMGLVTFLFGTPGSSESDRIVWSTLPAEAGIITKLTVLGRPSTLGDMKKSSFLLCPPP